MTLRQQLGPPAGYVQVPRFWVMVNQYQLQHALSVEVHSNNYSEPSRFEVQAAVTPASAKFLEEQPSLNVTVQVIALSGTQVTLIYGLVDSLVYDPINGIMLFSGRDLAGLLVDAPTEEPFQQSTSSDIAAFFASQWAQYGLLTNITATTTPVGRYYGLDYDFTTYGQFYRATNQWDMLLMLAHREGFIVRMDGKTLYFGPPPMNNGPMRRLAIDSTTPQVQGNTAVTNIASNAESITLNRSLTLAKDVQVTVVSWQSLLNKPVVRRVRSTNQKAPPGGNGPVQNYVEYVTDATPEQALQYAQKMLTQITQRERVVEVTIPGELDLTPSDMVELVGTGTGWDQNYYIDHIIRKLSYEGGFTETIRLKNVSPSTQKFIQ